MDEPIFKASGPLALPVALRELARSVAALLVAQPLDGTVRGPYLDGVRFELGHMLLDALDGKRGDTWRGEDAGDLRAIATARQIVDLPGHLGAEDLKVWITAAHAEIGRLIDGGFVHARGFPCWGPATMCGEPGKVPTPSGEITCPSCVVIVGDGAALAARAAQVECELGPPDGRFVGGFSVGFSVREGGAR